MPENSYARDQVVSIINSVIHKVREPHETSREMICKELHDLKIIMEELRAQLGQTSAKDVLSKHIPSATDELDAVSGATEEATITIMNACEQILLNLGGVPADSGSVIEGEVTRIYEACTFQDITGQRIGKVVKTLKLIDAKISDLLGALEKFGDSATGDVVSSGPEPANLLNGPALPHQDGLSQDEIDRLLNGV